MIPSKEHIQSPVTDPANMEIHELPDKELKIISQKMLRELQENPDLQHVKGIIHLDQVKFVPGRQE